MKLNTTNTTTEKYQNPVKVNIECECQLLTLQCHTPYLFATNSREEAGVFLLMFFSIFLLLFIY